MNPQNAPKGELYNLKWRNYLSNLSQIVLEHHLSEKLVDVTLVCDGHYIRAHKLVLSACSIFFQDLFKINSSNIEFSGSVIHPFIVMSGIQFNHLKYIIDFMYQGEIKVLDSDLEGVLALGQSLQIKGLSSVTLKPQVNNQVEQSVSPAPVQSEPLKPHSPNANSKFVADQLKNSSNCSMQNSITQPAENLSLHGTQDEPKNYSKVTLDALVEKNMCVQEIKTEEQVVQIPLVIGYPVKISDDFEQSTPKKAKVNPPPLVIRKSDMIKRKSSTLAEQVQKTRPVIKENPEIFNSRFSHPTKVGKDYSSKDKKSDIPKPPNAFMIFANEWRKKLAVEHPAENNKDISIRLGNLWKTLSPETKENYYQAAQSALKEHELKYPQSIIKQPPLKKKKFVVTSLRTENLESSSESINMHGDDDDLEIIESPETIESSQGSNSSIVST